MAGEVREEDILWVEVGDRERTGEVESPRDGAVVVMYFEVPVICSCLSSGNQVQSPVLQLKEIDLRYTKEEGKRAHAEFSS